MEREEAIKILKEERWYMSRYSEEYKEAYDMAIEALSADAVSREDTVTLNSPISIQAETVAVVRCKDCKYSGVYGKTTRWLACENVMEGQATDPDGYCYLGERKEP